MLLFHTCTDGDPGGIAPFDPEQELASLIFFPHSLQVDVVLRKGFEELGVEGVRLVSLDHRVNFTIII